MMKSQPDSECVRERASSVAARAAGGRRQSGRSSRREKNGVAELHPSSGDMRRREKRLLQVAGLLLAALLFLPNVGLWSLYRDRAFYNSPNTDGPGGTLPLQVSGAPS